MKERNSNCLRPRESHPGTQSGWGGREEGGRREGGRKEGRKEGRKGERERDGGEGEKGMENVWEREKELTVFMKVWENSC